MAVVKRENPKAFETLALKLKQLDGVEGRVGWFETMQYENGTPVAMVAAVQELGANAKGIIIPLRPFMRPTAVAKRGQWAETAAAVAKDALSGGNQTGVEIMELVTQQAENDVRKAINTLTQPALSPVTLELRAMKKKNPLLNITRATVGEAARRVAEPGYQRPDVNDKPLEDTGHMADTLTHDVEKKG